MKRKFESSNSDPSNNEKRQKKEPKLHTSTNSNSSDNNSNQQPEKSVSLGSDEEGAQFYRDMKHDNPKEYENLKRMRDIFMMAFGYDKEKLAELEKQSKNDPIKQQRNKIRSENRKWCRENNATTVRIPGIRADLEQEAKKQSQNTHTMSIKSLVYNTVQKSYKIDLPDDACELIELCSLSTDMINIIELDHEIFSDAIQEFEQENHGKNVIKSEFLEKTRYDINDSIFTPFINQRLFNNWAMKVQFDNPYQYDDLAQYDDLFGDCLKCGDIVIVSSGFMPTIIDKLYLVVDNDNKTLIKIGMTTYYSDHYQYPHIVIPGFVTNRYLDVIKSYSSLIKYFCWEDTGDIVYVKTHCYRFFVVFLLLFFFFLL